MIYVDTPFKVDPAVFTGAPQVFKGNYSAHLTADTVDELVAYATEIGMKSSWLQDGKNWRFHFDVTGVFLRKILVDSRVKKITAKELAKIFIDRRQLFLSSRFRQPRPENPDHPGE